jgi:hypothetical protein
MKGSPTMQKLTLIFVIILLTVLPITYAQEEITPGSLAVDWLIEQQGDAISIQDDPDLTAIVAAVRGLYGHPDEDMLLWLATMSAVDSAFGDPDTAGIALLAVLSHEENVKDFGAGSLLENFQRAVEDMDEDDIPNRCFTQIVSVNAVLPGALGTMDQIAELQNPDGGFPLSLTESPSDIVASALCTHIIAIADQPEPLEKALKYLKSKQNADGGWGSFAPGTSDAITTAFVMMALNAADQDMAEWGEALPYLLAQQDRETGAVPSEDDYLTIVATAFFALAVDGHSFNDFQALDY